MAIEFDNPLVAGTVLVRSDIESQNYQQGTSGWIINQDGSAEFNDVVIRGGTVISGTALYYDPSPGAGNLILSIAAAAGTDPYGNAYDKGITWYNTGEAVVEIGSSLPNLFDLDGVAAISLPTSRLAALVNGSVAFVPTANSYAVSSALGLAYFTSFDPALMRLQLQSGRVLAYPDQMESFILMDSSTTGRFAEITMEAESTVPDDFILNVVGSLQLGNPITQYAGGNFDDWTLTVSGGGSATYSRAEGFCQKIGTMWFVRAYFVVGTAGTGSTAVTFTLPVIPYRSSARQNIPGCARDGGVVAGPCGALMFAGGSGASVDRIVNSAGDDVVGSTLTAGSIWTFEGWIREA